MKSFRRWLQGVVFVAGMCMIAGAARAQTTKPAGSAPASKPSSLDAAMKYAPEGAAGVIHIEVKALIKDVLAAIAKEPAFRYFESNTIQAIGKLAEKIDSLDLFLPWSPAIGSSFLMVVHGPVTAADLNGFLQSVAGVEEDALVKMEKRRGRYRFALAAIPWELAIGGESPDLPMGVTAIGMDNNTAPEALAKLGKGKNEDLAKVLAGVDAAAPIWVAVVIDQGEPRTIDAGIYLLGGGRSKLGAVYQDANSAVAAMKDLQDPNSGAALSMFLHCIGEPSVDGAVLRISSKDTEAVLPKFISALAEMRREGKKELSMAYLTHIGGTMTVYSADHDDMLPADLLDLVKARAIPAQMLVSPVTGRTVNVDANGLPPAAFEPDYAIVKYPMSSLKIKDRAKRVLAYERPENYKKAGTLVLYVDEHVEWVKMEAFDQQLKATQDWIAAQAKEATTKETKEK